MEMSDVIKSCNLADYILTKMDAYGDRIAEIDSESGTALTYRELSIKIRLFASYLNINGIKPGDVICLCTKNNEDYVWLLLGSIYIGAICVLIGPGIKPRELQHFMLMVEPKWFITRGLSHELESAILKFESIKKILLTSEIVLPDDASRVEYLCCSDEESTAIILSSSGSSGLPKGVMLTHKNIIAVLESSGNFISKDDRYLGFLPFYHAFGLVILFCTLCEGSQAIIMADFGYATFIDNITKYQVTILFLIPSLLTSLSKTCETFKEPMKSVKRIFTGAAQVSPKIQEKMLKRFKHIELYHSYGMTETCFVTFWGKYKPEKQGSCGKLVKNCKCKVISVNGNTLNCGEIGELCFKGPSIMKGYLNNIEATEKAIDCNGWLHSGDLGYFDEEGFFFIIDRIKEIIKYQGHQISPSEIESVLLTHKGVMEAAVVGVPHSLYGELPRAFVVKTDLDVTEHELINLIKDELSSYKQLRGGLFFVESLPKTLSGKISKKELKQLI